MGDRCFILSMNDHIDEEQSRNRKDGRFEVLGSGDAVRRCPRRGRGGAAGRLGARARTRQPARRLARLARPTRPPARPHTRPSALTRTHTHARAHALPQLAARTPRGPAPGQRGALPDGPRARAGLSSRRAPASITRALRGGCALAACAHAAHRWHERALSRCSAPAGTRAEAIEARRASPLELWSRPATNGRTSCGARGGGKWGGATTQQAPRAAAPSSRPPPPAKGRRRPGRPRRPGAESSPLAANAVHAP